MAIASTTVAMMHRLVSLIPGLLLFLQAAAQSKTWRFDFGGPRVAPGYLAVTDSTIYTEARGYGFTSWSRVVSVDRGGNPLTGDFVTGDRPFYFSVRLPEGNFDVRITLGDSKGTSATTVRAECRRLMLENIRTAKGRFTTQTFTVHLRDSLIRDQQGRVVKAVKIKSRETDFLHWDPVLTLEFSDSAARVCAVEITRNSKATTVFLAGNSTVVDQDREPWAAWGQILPRYLLPGKVVVANYAESGETMKAFEAEGRLDKIWSLAKAGDYLFIEFAHNDQKPGGNHLDPFTSYQQTLKAWIHEARQRKLIPVLVTSMHRRRFDSSGHIENTLAEYPEAMRQTAREEKLALIDLNTMSKTLYETWGPAQSLKAFVHYPANTFPGQAKALEDNTHFTPYGATALAHCVLYSLLQQRHPLALLIRNRERIRPPERPLSPDTFYWPMSLFVTGAKPEGN